MKSSKSFAINLLLITRINSIKFRAASADMNEQSFYQTGLILS